MKLYGILQCLALSRHLVKFCKKLLGVRAQAPNYAVMETSGASHFQLVPKSDELSIG